MLEFEIDYQLDAYTTVWRGHGMEIHQDEHAEQIGVTEVKYSTEGVVLNKIPLWEVVRQVFLSGHNDPGLTHNKEGYAQGLTNRELKDEYRLALAKILSFRRKQMKNTPERINANRAERLAALFASRHLLDPNFYLRKLGLDSLISTP